MPQEKPYINQQLTMLLKYNRKNVKKYGKKAYINQ
jgi:hypothetical protein